jgi:hypothetical protein
MEMEIDICLKTTMTEMVNDDDDTSSSMIHLLVCLELVRFFKTTSGSR